MMHAVQDILWKIREGFIQLTVFLNFFYSDKNNEYYVRLYSC